MARAFMPEYQKPFTQGYGLIGEIFCVSTNFFSSEFKLAS